ncbi:DUF308 domain-containing protein [Mycoplasmatota bacterium zrk1]
MNKLGLKQIIVGVLLSLLGFIMIGRPIESTSIYIIVLSLLIMTYSTYELVFLFKEKSSGFRAKVVSSVLTIFICMLVVISPLVGMKVFIYIIALFIIVTSIYRLSSHYKKYERVSYLSIGTIILGVIMIFDPIVVIGVTTSLISLSLILLGVIKILIGIVVNKFSGSSFQMFKMQDNFYDNKKEDDNFIDVDYKDLE